MILSETQERFVKAIAAQVSLEQIAEIHFFQPIRQGGAESGVAVIATRPERSDPAPSPAGQPEAPLDGHSGSHLEASVASHPGPSEGSTTPPPTDDRAAQISAEQAGDAVAESVDVSEPQLVNADTETLVDDTSPATSGEVVELSQAELDLPVNVESGELPPPEPEVSPVRSAPPSNERYVIYTARYRLTLKGPDRGKWETNVVAEADAPLLTVDAVVRGVQRRSGDVEDPIRLTGEELISLTRRTQHPAA